MGRLPFLQTRQMDFNPRKNAEIYLTAETVNGDMSEREGLHVVSRDCCADL